MDVETSDGALLCRLVVRRLDQFLEWMKVHLDGVLLSRIVGEVL